VFLCQKTRASCSSANDNDGNQTNDSCNGVNEYHSSDIHEPVIEPVIPTNTNEAQEMADSIELPVLVAPATVLIPKEKSVSGMLPHSHSLLQEGQCFLSRET
jgi:hypothetical protein